MSLNDLNEKAKDRFEEIKSKRKWLINQVEVQGNKHAVKVDIAELQKMLDEPIERRIVNEKVVVHNEEGLGNPIIRQSVMDFIDSLNLSPNLSIAIANILTYKEKDDNERLSNAIKFILMEQNS